MTDIIRFNVERFLRDMDDPELALEYVDLEDFTVGRVKAAKSYQVDLAFRFTTDEADQREGLRAAGAAGAGSQRHQADAAPHAPEQSGKPPHAPSPSARRPEQRAVSRALAARPEW